MRYDYTWRCDCDGAEGTCPTLAAARRESRAHLRTCTFRRDDGKPLEVFIDQYDLDAGEMSDRWWKLSL